MKKEEFRRFREMKIRFFNSTNLIWSQLGDAIGSSDTFNNNINLCREICRRLRDSTKEGDKIFQKIQEITSSSGTDTDKTNLIHNVLKQSAIVKLQFKTSKRKTLPLENLTHIMASKFVWQMNNLSTWDIKRHEEDEGD